MQRLRKPSCPRAFYSFARAAVSIAALGCASIIASPAGAQQVPVEGKPVAQVRVVDESGRAVSEPIPSLPLSSGHLFDFAQERESLRKLYAMGDFSDIRVAA